MRKHRNSSTLHLPTSAQHQEASRAYRRHDRNARLLQSQLRDLVAQRDRWQDLGYEATAAYLDSRIQCLTGIAMMAYDLRRQALCQMLGKVA